MELKSLGLRKPLKSNRRSKKSGFKKENEEAMVSNSILSSYRGPFAEVSSIEKQVSHRANQLSRRKNSNRPGSAKGRSKELE